MSNITIYHNPACGTSRNTLEMIRNSGNEPTIIYYLDTPPTRDELIKLISDMGITVRALLRKNVEPYEHLGLDEEKFSDEQLIDFMLQHPILINRPVVVTPLGTRLCRPSEIVLDIRHCCKVSDEAAFCLIQRPYISKTLLTRRISPRGSP